MPITTWPPIDPRESVVIEFTFDGSALTDVELSVIAYSRFGAADDAPAGILVGEHQVQGAKVLQQVTGGVDLVDYYIDCKARVDGADVLVATACLPVREK